MNSIWVLPFPPPRRQAGKGEIGGGAVEVDNKIINSNMNKQTHVAAVALLVLVALVIGWFAGRWYLGYQIEREADQLMEQFGDFIEDFDDSEIIDTSDLDALNQQFIPSLSDFTTCEADGETYYEGDEYFDGCNWCSCNVGSEWICTEKACDF